MTADRVHVTIAADASYLPWAATAMLSALDRHEAGTLVFHLLHDGSVTAHDRERLEGLVERSDASIRLYTVDDERIGALRPPHSGSPVTWFRLIVADVLREVPRALLLDADTFVADDLASLWATPLQEAPLAAVANVTEPSKRAHLRSLGIEDPSAYLNAGVLLLDLERWRSEAASAALLRFAAGNADRISWLDQDTLNVVFAGRWLPLHPRWNAMNSLWVWPKWAEEVFGADAVREAKASPGVLHFEGPGPLKPWHALSDHAWRGAYRQTLSRTPWGGAPLVHDTTVVRLIAHLPPSWRLRAYWRWVKLRRRSSSRWTTARPGTTRSSS